MTPVLSRFRGFALHLFLLATALCAGSRAWAAASTGAPTLPSYASPGYIINSDRTVDTPAYSTIYNRWYLPAQGSVSISATPAGATSYYRVGLRITDAGTPMNIEGQDVDGFVYTAWQSFTPPTAITTTLTFNANLVPASGTVFDPNKTYKVQSKRQEWNGVAWVDAGSTVSSASNYSFVHFTGAFATDTLRNMRTRLNSASWNKRYAVNTDSGNNSFTVSTSVSLYRYDEPQAGFTGTLDITNYRLTYALYDTLDLVTPIATTSTSLTSALFMGRNSNGGSGFTIPYATTLARTITLTPASGVQLDSPNRTYRLVVTVSHPEDTTTSVYTASTTLNTTDEQLQHFNGRLLFGTGGNQIATTMNDVTNDTTVGAVDWGTYIGTSVTIPAGMGSIDGSTGYTFSGNIPVFLLANGDATCSSGGPFAVAQPVFPDSTVQSRIRFLRAGMALSSGGLSATLAVYLPSGMGWASVSTRKQLAGSIAFSSVNLNQSLIPSTDLTYTPAGNMWVTEETRPLAYQVSSMVWSISSGTFNITPVAADKVVYHRAAELSTLASSATIPASERYKRSNEQYLRFVNLIDGNITVSATSGRAALFSTKLQLSPGAFRSHFPYDGQIAWGGPGRIHFEKDVNVPADSYLDATPAPAVKMPYGADCTSPSCGSAPSSSLQFIADASRLTITEDGGLIATGLLSAPLQLRWGYIPTKADYAHKVSTFADGNFMMAGHFIRGSDYSVTTAQAPGMILFSGAEAATGLVTDRPGKPAYLIGLGDYAGMNFRCGPPDSSASTYTGDSILAGDAYGSYTMKNRSKYYVRQGGVSGIHDSFYGSAPTNASFYGYTVTLTNFGLNFLDNVNQESRTEGSIHVKTPSDLSQDFEELTFLCNGALDTAKVPGGTSANMLAYWQAPIDISGIAFVRDEGAECDVGTGFLTLAVAGYASHVKETLYGTLGFLSNGNLIPKSLGINSIDSRLKMPALTHIRGPKVQTGGTGYEEYQVTPVSDAYFNITGASPTFTHAAPADLSTGMITFAGLAKVPFFSALEVQFQTTSNRPPTDPADTAGPWSVAVLSVANGSWGGSSFFAGAYFDDQNRGYPLGTVTNTDYLGTATYYVHARQEWLGGAIAFDYPLVWSSTTRSFKSPETVENDFVIVQMQHQVKYLSAERLELAFGAQYDGLPQINLTNFVFNAIDDATGMAQATIEALTQNLVDQMNAGIDSLADMLNDQLTDFYDSIFAATLDAPGGFLDGIYNDLAGAWTGGSWNVGTVNGILTARFNAAGGVTSLKGSVFNRLADVSGGAVDQIDMILQHIETIKDAIDAIAEIAIPTNPEVKDYTKDLAAKLVERLATEINGNLAAILGGAGAYEKIANLLDPLLTELEPTLNQIRDVLVEVQGAFQQVKEKLDPALGGAQEFLTEMRDIFNTANNLVTGDFGALSTEVSVALDFNTGFLADFGVGAGQDNLLAYSPAEIKARIRQEIMDRFMATAFVTQVQVAIKQQIQDLANSLTTATGSVFAQVNEAVKGVLSGALAEVDNTINGLLGPISDYMGAGKIDGYAYFQGDALRKLRIDAEFTWKIPEESTLKAFAEINQYTSEGDSPACYAGLPADMTATEVTIGAENIGCGFLGLDIKVDVAVKLSFLGSSTPWSLAPIGIGGSFAMTEGEISFEAFKITDLAAGVAFGEFENYITASIGMQIGNYGARGGVFFGRTCTIDPIKLWDPFAAEALGDPNPTFSGAYVYGEAHIPVSEAILGIPATCMFQITADAGLGIFYFVEGPTYGGRLGLGVDGELLCLLSIGGRIDMIGFKQGDAFKLKGKGEVHAEVGWCDFCVEVSKTIEMETTVGADGSMNGGQSSN